MKIKKVIAPTMPDAMKKIKEELGQEAIILNSKEVQTGGLFGFFTKKNVEVIAAIDPTPRTMGEDDLYSSKTDNHVPLIDYSDQDQQVKQELEEIKKAVDQLKVDGFEGHTHSDLPQEIMTILYYLNRQEVLAKHIKAIEKKLIKEWYKYDETLTTNEIKEIVYQYLLETLSSQLFSSQHGGKHMINLVGPTGVGKTTTLAKLASKAVLEDHKKVALITTDTFRIAAIEQLRTYADLLNIPLKVSYTIDDFKKAVQSLSDYDLILIDSAGRNYLNAAYMNELKETIDFSDDMTTYLVLSATSKFEDMKAIFLQFSEIPISQLIFTKIDETRTYGPIFNLLYEYKVGVSYVTDGQNVPDDIYEASKEDLISNLLGVANDG